MTDTSDIRFLLTIQAGGSLLAAARALGVTPSAVSQRLQQLEARVGARLVDRSARRLRFTDEGALLCRRGEALVHQLDELMQEVQASQAGLLGRLSVCAPLGFGRRYVAPLAADFQRLNPRIEVALTLSDEPLAVAAERHDVIVHIGALPASNLIGHAIAPNARLLVAAPAVLRRFGTPQTPEDLAGMPCIVLRENNEDVSLWSFAKGRTTRSVRVPAPLSCNDGDVIRQWAVEGRGVILRSEWDVADDLRAGRLVRLLPGWKAPDANVVALTHDRAGLPRRTRDFMAHLQAGFKGGAPWRVASSAP
ncbi:LysR family transcriptional regulator [Pseudomonadota bacterium AL_CKDN230030165-1A_HGKHYDSX7]